MSRELEARVNAIAGRQHGVITRRQFLEAGVSPAAIGRRLASGRLRALHRGVYLLGPVQPERATQLAAALAGGPAAVLSHSSAAPLWRMPELGGSGNLHVSVPGSGRAPRPGICFHRIGPLAADERAMVDAIPVTSPARTLVDLAGVLGSREIELAVAVALREGLLRPEELRALPRRYPGRAGMAALRAAAGDAADPALTRSVAERRCLDLLRAAGLPRPHANVPLGPYELDLFWPDEMLAIEIDGRAFHASARRFEGDRRKDAWLRARGIEVMRLTWRQITRDAIATAVQVGQAFALARARRSPRPVD